MLSSSMERCFPEVFFLIVFHVGRAGQMLTHHNEPHKGVAPMPRLKHQTTHDAPYKLDGYMFEHDAVAFAQLGLLPRPGHVERSRCHPNRGERDLLSKFPKALP